MSGGWQGSRRRFTLPDGWAEIRRTVLDRDGDQCTAILETTGARCAEPAADVDHIDRHGSQTDLNNLRALCAWHHGRKSSAEGNASRAPRPSAGYPRRRHPGLIGD